MPEARCRDNIRYGYGAVVYTYIWLPFQNFECEVDITKSMIIYILSDRNIPISVIKLQNLLTAAW